MLHLSYISNIPFLCKRYIAKNIDNPVLYLQRNSRGIMRNSKWKEGDILSPQYVQLRLFPPTEYEILLARVNELEEKVLDKMDRQRKAQFGKIGRHDKRLADLETRFEWMERALCHSQKNEEDSKCEILEMVGQ